MRLLGQGPPFENHCSRFTLSKRSSKKPWHVVEPLVNVGYLSNGSIAHFLGL